MILQTECALVDLEVRVINMTIDEFLDQRVRRQDYLSEQDEAYIRNVNGFTDILMTYGSDDKVKKIMEDFIHYIDKYAYPVGLAQRVWAYDDAVEEADAE